MKRFLLLYLSFKPSKLFFATRSGKNFMTLFLNRVLFVCTSSLSSQPWGGRGGEELVGEGRRRVWSRREKFFGKGRKFNPRSWVFCNQLYSLKIWID